MKKFYCCLLVPDGLFKFRPEKNLKEFFFQIEAKRISQFKSMCLKVAPL